MGPAGLADDSLRKWWHRTLIHVVMHALGMVRTLSISKITLVKTGTSIYHDFDYGKLPWPVLLLS